MREAISEDDLARYIEQHIVREVKISRYDGGPKWFLAVRLGGPLSKWLPVRSQRKAVRTWAKLDTLVNWADSQGVRGAILEL